MLGEMMAGLSAAATRACGNSFNQRAPGTSTAWSSVVRVPLKLENDAIKSFNCHAMATAAAEDHSQPGAAMVTDLVAPWHTSSAGSIASLAYQGRKAGDVVVTAAARGFAEPDEAEEQSCSSRCMPNLPAALTATKANLICKQSVKCAQISSILFPRSVDTNSDLSPVPAAPRCVDHTCASPLHRPASPIHQEAQRTATAARAGGGGGRSCDLSVRSGPLAGPSGTMQHKYRSRTSLASTQLPSSLLAMPPAAGTSLSNVASSRQASRLQILLTGSLRAAACHKVSSPIDRHSRSSTCSPSSLNKLMRSSRSGSGVADGSRCSGDRASGGSSWNVLKPASLSNKGHPDHDCHGPHPSDGRSSQKAGAACSSTALYKHRSRVGFPCSSSVPGCGGEVASSASASGQAGFARMLPSFTKPAGTDNTQTSRASVAEPEPGALQLRPPVSHDLATVNSMPHAPTMAATLMLRGGGGTMASADTSLDLRITSRSAMKLEQLNLQVLSDEGEIKVATASPSASLEAQPEVSQRALLTFVESKFLAASSGLPASRSSRMHEMQQHRRASLCGSGSGLQAPVRLHSGPISSPRHRAPRTARCRTSMLGSALLLSPRTSRLQLMISGRINQQDLVSVTTSKETAASAGINEMTEEPNTGAVVHGTFSGFSPAAGASWMEIAPQDGASLALEYAGVACQVQSSVEGSIDKETDKQMLLDAAHSQPMHHSNTASSDANQMKRGKRVPGQAAGGIAVPDVVLHNNGPLDLPRAASAGSATGSKLSLRGTSALRPASRLSSLGGASGTACGDSAPTQLSSIERGGCTAAMVGCNGSSQQCNRLSCMQLAADGELVASCHQLSHRVAGLAAPAGVRARSRISVQALGSSDVVHDGLHSSAAHSTVSEVARMCCAEDACCPNEGCQRNSCSTPCQATQGNQRTHLGSGRVQRARIPVQEDPASACC
jgi:hypothetical protein